MQNGRVKAGAWGTEGKVSKGDWGQFREQGSNPEETSEGNSEGKSDN